jgi:hypothetical protein
VAKIDKADLLQNLFKQPASTKLELLSAAFDAMNERQRQTVFGDYALPDARMPPDRRKLLQRVKRYYQDFLKGVYYAPFNVNSKNWMQIPAETQAWFGQLGEFLTDSLGLSRQGDHAGAVASFGLLYELIFAMERGDEIVFADELGSWMIPVDEKKVIAAYLKSLASLDSAEQYTATAVPLIKRDSHQSFADGVYASALRAANPKQKASLLTELERQQIETGPLKPLRRAQRGTKR